MKRRKQTESSILFMFFVGTGCLILIALLTYFAVKKDGGRMLQASMDQTDRASYHFTVPEKWKNDPQKPFYLDGKYHYYYLYNEDYPEGNGTAWRHAVSTDLVHWEDEGIAIPKYTNENGDIWSGSVVVDTHNTAGFGEGAVIALVTQPSADGGEQAQFLWYSQDRGYSYHSYSDSPVLANPGSEDFRDPKVIWDEEHKKWVMTLAEGTKIGFYESSNLKDWHYTGDYHTENIGLVECPDLYRFTADDGTDHWILGVSANGKSNGQPNTYAYWIGHYDGSVFIADHSNPQWLDYGFDWYGAVTFEAELKQDLYHYRYALAWMNNWDYPDETPTLKNGYNGTDSIVRTIDLRVSEEQEYYLASQPVETINKLASTKDIYEQLKVNGAMTLDTTGESYQLDADISWTDLLNVGVRLRESADQSRHVDTGIYVDEGYSYVNRAYTGQPDKSKRYVESRAPFDKEKKEVHLTILVDKTSIEVFIDDGRITYTNAIFPEESDQAITLYTEGGSAVFSNVIVKQLNARH